MPLTDLIKEADRVMVVCNACRYCEGFCAVFPAMELRRTFTQEDLKYLANLCHNCRDCYYACQYAPPHDFDLNVPKTLGELRLGTYERFARPRVLGGLFQRSGLWTALITTVSVLMAFLVVMLFRGTDILFSAHTGAGAFYRVAPYPLMVIPFSVLGIYIVSVLFAGVVQFVRDTGGKLGEIVDFRPNARAISDTLRLKYLEGGGDGCNYPDDRFSHVRRWFHHLVFYGFSACFASTAIAAIYDHLLKLPAPYPIWSWPVVLGTIGGAALLIGTGGLMVLKTKMDRAPAVPGAFGMDVGFLVMLFSTSLTGLLLLALRETPAMGVLLVVHLGIVGGLFITLPYGKFVHGVYRYAALVRNAIEQLREEN